MYAPYVTVAEQRQRAEQAAKKLAKAGRVLQPIEVAGREICHTWWGLSWCRNLEYFGDFANRLPRGRTYVRSGAVLDLRITSGLVEALVQGSELYEVKIKIKPLPADRKKELCDRCAADIGSTIDLLSGKFDRHIMDILTAPKRGLFPEPGEIEFECSCPDFATVCKHVAAVLYGIGVRFDASPELFFTLRGIDPAEFVAAATTGLTTPAPQAGADDILADASRQELGAVFGIEFAPEAAPSRTPPHSAPLPSATATTTDGKVVPSPAHHTPAPFPSSDHSAPAKGTSQGGRAARRASGADSSVPTAPQRTHRLKHTGPTPISGQPISVAGASVQTASPLPSSSIEAYVDSLFDPRTGQPIDVDASPDEAATESASSHPSTAKAMAKQRLREPLRGARAGRPAKATVAPRERRSSTTASQRPPMPSSKRRSQASAPKAAASAPIASAAPATRRRSPLPSPGRKRKNPASARVVSVSHRRVSKSSAPHADSSHLRPTGRLTTKPPQKNAGSKTPSKRNRLSPESPNLLPSRKATQKTAGSAPPKEWQTRFQPGQILTMAELRAFGISYAAVQRALLEGHLTPTPWRGQYATTCATLAWFESLEKQI